MSLLLICKSDRFSQKRVGRIRLLNFVEMDAVRTILLERRQVELWTIKRAVQYRLLQLHVDWNINLILLNCRLFWNLFWWFVNSTRDHQSARVFLYIIPGLVVRNFLVPWKSNSFQMFRIQSNFRYNKSGITVTCFCVSPPKYYFDKAKHFHITESMIFSGPIIYKIAPRAHKLTRKVCYCMMGR